MWRCSVIFLVKNGGTKPGSKGSCLKNKRLEDKGRKWIAGESLKETKNLKLMLNVTFIDEKLFILIARKVIEMLWLFVVYCFVFGVFLSRRLRIALVNVSKCVVEASWYKGNLWPGIRPSRKINRFENVDKTKLRLPNYCPELDIQNLVYLFAMASFLFVCDYLALNNTYPYMSKGLPGGQQSVSLRSMMSHVTSGLVGKRGLRAWKREKFEQMLDECSKD